jgi:hypothetical protein
MSFIYLDDSKHHERGFSLATFVIFETDPQIKLSSLFSKHGFNPTTFEFKSSLAMKEDPSLQNLRSGLRHFISRECKIAVCVVTGDKNLGPASLCLLQKALKHEHLLNASHDIFFDEGLFSSRTSADKMVEGLEEFKKCAFHFEQDSKNILGIQIADLAAHTCATMLSETLGFIDKMVKIDRAHSGYDHIDEFELGFELWAGVRTNFLSVNKTDDQDDPDFSVLQNIEPFGLFVHESVNKTVSMATYERFGEMYIGCMH